MKYLIAFQICFSFACLKQNSDKVMPETWLFSYQYNIYKLPQNADYYVGQIIARKKATQNRTVSMLRIPSVKRHMASALV
jgi:hypothetical protein